MIDINALTAEEMIFIRREKIRREQRARYWDEPEAYFVEILGLEATPDQIAVARLVRYSDKRYIGVKACNGGGKTAIAGAIAMWWMDCAPGYTPGGARADHVVYTTAPTMRQVVNNLWKEIRIRWAHAKRKPRGNILPKEPRWDQDTGSFAQGMSATDEDQIKGQHAAYFLFIIDEAQGVLATIFAGIITMIKGKYAKVLAIGNCNQRSGEFFEAWHEKSEKWDTMTIPARTHPNVVAGLAAMNVDWKTWKAAPYGFFQLPEDFEDPIPGAVSLYDLDEAKLDYGVGSPAWQVVVEAEFADMSERSLIWLSWVDIARRNAEQDAVDESPLPMEPLPERMNKLEGKWAGVDVAVSGADRSVMVKRNNGVFESIEVWTDRQLHFTAGKITQAVRDGYKVNYDEGGLGIGLTSHLEQDGECTQGVNVFRNVPGGKPDSKYVKYATNMRTQLWQYGADYLRLGHVDLSQLPLDQFRSLKGELTAVEYDLNSKSMIIVESKDELKKRIGRSPDVADAFNLCLRTPPRVESIAVYQLGDTAISGINGMQW